MRRSKALLSVLALGLAACAEVEGVAPGLHALFETADVELYALDPLPRLPDEPVKARPTFHGYPALGHFPLSPAERDVALDVLTGGLGEGEPLACFDPRHAIVARSAGRTTTVLVSFECGQVAIHRDGGREDRAAFSSTRHALLDGMLIRHGVPLVRRTR